MKQYQEFLEKINSYFQYDEVISEGSIISAYDLIRIIKEEMNNYYTILNDNTAFKNAINDFYTSQVPFGIFLKRFKKVSIVSVDYIRYGFEDNHARVVIKFNGESLFSSKYIRICKDSETDELYFDKFGENDREFVAHFYQQILDDLQKTEELFYLFKLTNPNIKEIPYDEENARVNEEISDDFLKIIISYNPYGKVEYKIMIDPSVDPDDIYSREWINHESIKEYVEKKCDELLKKIAINMFDLKESTQKIITDYYAHNNTQEQKLELK